MDETTGAPIANAWVSIGFATEGPGFAECDDNGCFRVCTPATDKWFIVYSGPGHALKCWPGEGLSWFGFTPCGIRLPLKSAGKLVGRVVDVDGNAVTEGHVRVYDEEQWQFSGDPDRGDVGFDYWLWERECRHALDYGAWSWLGPDGTFEIDNVLAGEPVHVLVHSIRALPEFQPPLTIETGDTRELAIVVKKPAMIRGRIRMPTLGRAETIYDATVLATAGESREQKRDTPRCFPIQSDGSYVAGPLWPSSEYTLCFFLRVADAAGSPIYPLRCVETAPLDAEQDLVLDIDNPNWW